MSQFPKFLANVAISPQVLRVKPTLSVSRPRYTCSSPIEEGESHSHHVGDGEERGPL